MLCRGYPGVDEHNNHPEAISRRPDGLPAGGHRAPVPQGRRAHRASPDLPPPGDRLRHPLPGPGRLLLADAAARLPPLGRPSPTTPTPGGTPGPGSGSMRPCGRRSGGRRQGGDPEPGDHRQPGRRDDRGRRPRGIRRGKKAVGRERHPLVDTLGPVRGPAVLAAAPTVWGGALEVFERAGRRLPRPAKVLADRAYRACALAAWIEGH